MTFSAMNLSRTRLLALLVVAVFSFGALGAASIASATDASIAKKCKKGYKKVGKKCKKKKKSSKPAPKPETVVSGATLASVHQVARTKVLIKGTVSFSKAPAKGTLTAVVNITTQSGGNVAAQATIKVAGGSTTQPFNELSIVPPLENPKDAKLTLLGIDYNTVPVT